MAAQICVAMDFLEAKRVVHRDLATRNVLLKTPCVNPRHQFHFVLLWCVLIHKQRAPQDTVRKLIPFFFSMVKQRVEGLENQDSR